MNILVFGNGSSIHTLRLLESLSLEPRFHLFPVDHESGKLMKELDSLGRHEDVFHIAPRSVSQDTTNYQYLFNLPRMRSIVQRVGPAVISTIYLTSYGTVGSLLTGHRYRLLNAVGAISAYFSATPLTVFHKWRCLHSSAIFSNYVTA